MSDSQPNKKIQMVDLFTQYKNIESEVSQAILNVIESTAFINGPAVKQLKDGMQKEFNVKHVIPCANGTDAIQIALMALDLKPGDEIITTTFTFIATAEVIALLQLTPVFVDVDPNNYCISPAAIKEKITDKTKVILPVHLYGHCAPMEEILNLAKEHNLKVIEDTAQGIGSGYTFTDGSKKFAGTMGDVGTTSFFPSKNLGCYGDGGAIMTNNDELAEKMAMIINHGSRVKYYHEIVGVNSRLDTMQAAVLNIKLPLLKGYSAARRKAADYYCEALKEVTEIETPIVEDYSEHVFHQFTMKVKNGKREALKEFLQQKGIPSMVYYPVCLHQQKAFEMYSNGESIPVSERLQKEVLSLPMHTELDEETLIYITKQIKTFFK
ncbi:MAG: UDP-2-acetamido-2-deoxy-ribo-hexuluronate aminotransferase [Glaciecola sp.]|jgi:UDP-2-acetamido-2-deoxy-ribo-hexuluronate aminotransferase